MAGAPRAAASCSPVVLPALRRPLLAATLAAPVFSLGVWRHRLGGASTRTTGCTSRRCNGGCCRSTRRIRRRDANSIHDAASPPPSSRPPTAAERRTLHPPSANWRYVGSWVPPDLPRYTRFRLVSGARSPFLVGALAGHEGGPMGPTRRSPAGKRRYGHVDEARACGPQAGCRSHEASPVHRRASPGASMSFSRALASFSRDAMRANRRAGELLP
jgi:hypothetical protein